MSDEKYKSTPFLGELIFPLEERINFKSSDQDKGQKSEKQLKEARRARSSRHLPGTEKSKSFFCIAMRSHWWVLSMGTMKSD